MLVRQLAHLYIDPNYIQNSVNIIPESTIESYFLKKACK